MNITIEQHISVMNHLGVKERVVFIWIFYKRIIQISVIYIKHNKTLVSGFIFIQYTIMYIQYADVEDIYVKFYHTVISNHFNWTALKLFSFYGKRREIFFQLKKNGLREFRKVRIPLFKWYFLLWTCLFISPSNLFYL